MFPGKSQVKVLVKSSLEGGVVINVGLSSNLNLVSSDDSVREFSTENVFILGENTSQSGLSWNRERAFRTFIFSLSGFELQVKV